MAEVGEVKIKIEIEIDETAEVEENDDSTEVNENDDNSGVIENDGTPMDDNAGYHFLSYLGKPRTSRARKTHVARCHREGLQCDICKRFFVNKTTLTTHLKLHEGPQPREKCHICNKMVRCVQLKYHIRRHENKTRYECTECDKVFSHLATYQAHLKYARPHASEGVFKYPCPMCHKGYPTKDQMQDHFNYQHLGKTKHKCPICDKPIASKANVERHMARVHGEKKEKPRNHVCQECGKAFTDKKAVTQHAAIHSAERPLSCEICFQTFKQKASLYTHRRRVHKVQTPKRVVEFMDTKVT